MDIRAQTDTPIVHLYGFSLHATRSVSRIAVLVERRSAKYYLLRIMVDHEVR